jgi:hypothetical protein
MLSVEATADRAASPISGNISVMRGQDEPIDSLLTCGSKLFFCRHLGLDFVEEFVTYAPIDGKVSVSRDCNSFTNRLPA